MCYFLTKQSRVLKPPYQVWKPPLSHRDPPPAVTVSSLSCREINGKIRTREFEYKTKQSVNPDNTERKGQLHEQEEFSVACFTLALGHPS